MRRVWDVGTCNSKVQLHALISPERRAVHVQIRLIPYHWAALHFVLVNHTPASAHFLKVIGNNQN